MPAAGTAHQGRACTLAATGIPWTRLRFSLGLTQPAGPSSRVPTPGTLRTGLVPGVGAVVLCTVGRVAAAWLPRRKSETPLPVPDNTKHLEGSAKHFLADLKVIPALEPEQDLAGHGALAFSYCSS